LYKLSHGRIVGIKGQKEWKGKEYGKHGKGSRGHPLLLEVLAEFRRCGMRMNGRVKSGKIMRNV
jgi:hypothetical protein